MTEDSEDSTIGFFTSTRMYLVRKTSPSGWQSLLCPDDQCRHHSTILRPRLVTFLCTATIGSLSNDDSDGNEDVRKAIGLISKTTTLHVHHALLYISLPSLHDYNVKVLNFTICQGREHKTTTFFFSSWTLIQSFRIQLQKNLPTFDKLNELE